MEVREMTKDEIIEAKTQYIRKHLERVMELERLLNLDTAHGKSRMKALMTITALEAKLKTATDALESIAGPNGHPADTIEYWTEKGYPLSAADTMATDTKIARDALKRIKEE